ncbi:MAG: ATP-binding cassette domain-containing protein [Clostridium sp.]
MVNSLIVNNIDFKYKEDRVLNNITFDYEGSGVIALLGPNGAGKTTLMRVMAGLMRPINGEVILDNIDVLRNSLYATKNIGYLPQNFEIYDNITGKAFLEYVCDAKGLSKKEKNIEINKVAEKFNLINIINKPFKKYSGGYKRRLGIAQAMIGQPKLIIVDEPTVGLDPEQRFEFRQYLADIGESTKVLISTHIVEDVEFYCKKIIMIDKGKVKFSGLHSEFINSAYGKIYSGEASLEEVNAIRHRVKILQQNNLEGGKVSIKAICEEYIPNGFSKVKCSLEDAYVYNQSK